MKQDIIVYIICMVLFSSIISIASDNYSLAHIVQSLDEAYQKKNQSFFNDDTDNVNIHNLENTYKNLIKNHTQHIAHLSSDNVDFNNTKIDLKNKNIDILCMFDKRKETIGTIFNDLVPLVSHTITDIDISYNKLTYLPLTRITTSCPNLIHVNASHNNITCMPFLNNEKQYTYLKTIQVHHNNISSLDLSYLLYAYPNLELLDISHNPVKKLEVQPIHFIKNLPTLIAHNTVLSLQSKKMVWNQYNDIMKMPYRKTIVLPGIVVGGFCGLITELIGIYGGDNNIKETTHMAFGIGTITGTMASLYMYYIYHKKLKEIEENIRDKLVFNDPTIIKGKLIKS